MISIFKKFFNVLHSQGLIYALLKVKHFLFRHIYLFLHIFIPTTRLTHLLSSGKVTLIRGLDVQHPQAIKKALMLLPLTINAVHNIEGKYICLYGKDRNFKNHDVVIVAHWDMDSIVDPYVIHMCQTFMHMGKKVILASAHPLNPSAAHESYSNWCHAIVCRTCSGYDFSSWKAALDCFPSIFEARELTLTNDSNFGPIHSFSHVHEKMQSIDCDFWGMSFGLGLAPALQSFYLVFKPQVIQHASFKNFFDNVPLDDNKEHAVLLEASMTLWLAIHGFTAGAYCKLRKFFEFPLYLQKYSPLVPLEFGVPFLKRLIFFSKSGYQQYLKYKMKYPDAYPWDLIEAYLKRDSLIVLQKKYNSEHE